MASELPRGRGRQARRETILDAAEEVFRRRGVSVATMDEVAQKSGLAKGTLYRYFPSKDDVYLGIAARGIRALHALLEQRLDVGQPGLEQVAAAVRAYAEFSRTFPTYFDAFCFFQSAELDFDNPTESLQECQEAYALVAARLARVIETGSADGSIRRGDDTLLSVALLSMSTTGFLSLLAKREAWLKRTFEGTDFVDRFAALLKDSLRG